ncbi:MAG TPA: two-component regulator propeller domain-containing protein [Chitinophagaceae bacterium]|nr:two-component regulator propeller domain-containing protein [Chitinophagaceae bacterium]
MRRILYLFFGLLFLLESRLTAFADPSDPFFVQHYDNRNGLSNSSINHIFRDADNILWVATWDGLNMYDGTSFHVFNYSKENDPIAIGFKSIGSNVIQHITEDKSGNIWIATIGGISRFEKHSGKFYNYFYNHNQQGKISEQEYSMAVDTAGNVYCLNQKSGLSYYDPLIDSFRNCALPAQISKINKIAFDDANHLWMLSNNGELDVWSGNRDQFKYWRTYRERTAIVNFFQVNHQVFFSTADNQLFTIDNTMALQKKVMQMKHGISSMIFYKEHYLLAAAAKGYDVYDNNFQPSSFLTAENRQMQGIRVTSWALGSEDILWYGTDGNGIIKIYPKTKSFGTVTTSDNGMPYNRSVRSFCEDDGNLWIGTKGSGIIRIKNFWQSSAASAINREYFLAPADLDNNAVYSLKKGNDELIYIGTDGKGIGIYDIKNKKFNKWNQVKGHNDYPEFGSVYAILQDEDNSLWLGTSGYGLVHLKINRDHSGKLALAFLERFTFNNNNTGPANDIIYALANGSAGQLWIGCRYGGLSLLNKNTKKFKTFKALTYQGSLSNNDVLSIYKDSRNRIWVGTSYGLNWIENADAFGEEPVFQKLTTDNGLPNNTIHAIEEDRTGHIWVSTNRGLAKVNQADLKVWYYQQSDGLQSNEFCDGAVWKDKLDNLFFGGTYGFNHFLPQNIRKTSWQPNLLLSGILTGGEPANENGFIVLNPDNNKPFDFSINRKDNFFELNSRAISFLNAEKCEYAYFLEGYDKAWHAAGTAGKIGYSNISPGNYTLHIKWSNGDGIWTDEMVLFQLEVKQYFWLTSYAFLAYTLIIAILVYLIYTWRKNKLEIKHQLAVEHVMRTKEEEIHQNRLGFFTNIAHELQTPLTLIMGSAERFLDKTFSGKEHGEKPYFLSLIHQQASKLTYLVHQLMEFRKVEAGFFKNQYSYLDISELLNNLAEPFIPLSEQKLMRYEINILPDITGWADKDKLEKIIFNLLSNAFKHSGKNEQIVFSANENTISNELEITIANSGIHLSADQLNQLFDKFYVANQNVFGTEKFGTGIGLAFTQQLVTLLNGRIGASSENGWIIFKVFLPLTVAEMPVDDNQAISGKPSYLYQAITSYTEPVHPISAIENNKQAIIKNLQENDRKKILVVEDEPGIRYLLKDILKDDYIVYESEDGQKALELIGKIVPDLVICDVLMPNMNGLELCNKMKNAPATCQVPFILLSARSSEDHHMEGYEVGADAYIAKPFHTAYLKLRIRKLLEYRQKLHDLFKDDKATDLIGETDMADADKTFLTKLVQIIEERLDEPELNAAFIEKEFSLSKMQLYRKLKTMTGMTPGEFIKHIRLKQAAQLLVSTHFTVSEIFYKTGFNNQSYFFREFKKRYNCSPNEYREQQTIQG